MHFVGPPGADPGNQRFTVGRSILALVCEQDATNSCRRPLTSAAPAAALYCPLPPAPSPPGFSGSMFKALSCVHVVGPPGADPGPLQPSRYKIEIVGPTGANPGVGLPGANPGQVAIFSFKLNSECLCHIRPSPYLSASAAAAAAAAAAGASRPVAVSLLGLLLQYKVLLKGSFSGMLVGRAGAEPAQCSCNYRQSFNIHVRPDGAVLALELLLRITFRSDSYFMRPLVEAFDAGAAVPFPAAVFLGPCQHMASKLWSSEGCTLSLFGACQEDKRLLIHVLQVPRQYNACF